MSRRHFDAFCDLLPKRPAQGLIVVFFFICFLMHFSSPPKLLCLNIICKHLLLTIFGGLSLLHPKYESRKHFQN